VILPVVYDGLTLDAGYRLDLLINQSVIVEIKAADGAPRLFESQVLTYLKLSKLRLGFLINFNVAHLRDGLKRLVL